MSLGRIVAAGAASLAVAGAVALAIGMSRAEQRTAADPDPLPSSSSVAVLPAELPMSPAAVASTQPASSSAAPTATPSSTATTSTSAAPRTSAAAVVPPVRQAAPAPVRTTPACAVAPAPRPAGSALPLRFSTGSATRVITVTARSGSSTTATLQAWTKVSGGWQRYGSAVTAHIGADGMSSHPSEWRSATPIGSFTLTQAFGRDSNPGTGLPYFRTSPADWWISQTTGSGARLYNTHQHCSSGCSFVQGDPNEHLYYETPYYDYAVVIDYNTRNAPGGVHLGAGSAFFLHVTDGSATAGCVAIPESRLVPLMRWLTPSAHPRILIGVT